MNSGKEFSYQITQKVAVLSQSSDGRYTTEANYISYNGGKPKFDIRKWDRHNDKMFKGISLNDSEAEALKVALAQGVRA
nr:MAG TPA: hypothetical protein [Caudoviricetes sp.]